LLRVLGYVDNNGINLKVSPSITIHSITCMGSCSQANYGNVTAAVPARQQLQRLRKYAFRVIVGERCDGTRVFGTVGIPDPDGAVQGCPVCQRTELAVVFQEYFVNAKK
jgi:hypothetical protein